MPDNVAEFFALFVVPYFHEIVRPARDDLLAVGRPADIENVVRVTLERLHELARWHLENLDEFIGGPGRKQLAIGAETDAEDGVAVSRFDLECELARRVEDLDFAIFGRCPATRRDQFAIGRIRDGDDAIREATNPHFRRAFVGVPQRHFLVATGRERLAVGAVRHRFDERNVCGVRGLAVGEFEFGIDQRFLEFAGLAVEQVDLVAAPGGDDGFIGCDRHSANRFHDRGWQVQHDLWPHADLRSRRGFRALLDPKFQHGDFLAVEIVRVGTRWHDRVFVLRGKHEEVALHRLARHDGDAAFAALHDARVVGHVVLAAKLRAGVTDGTFVRKDRLHVLRVVDRVGAGQHGGRDRRRRGFIFLFVGGKRQYRHRE